MPAAAAGKIIDRDDAASAMWLRALKMTAHIDDQPARIFPLVIDELAQRFGPAPALIGTGESFSYASLAAQVRRYARWAQAEGVRRGDVVALMLGNCPDYLALWLGIARAGGVAALINTNLRGDALAHCLDVADPGHVIVAADLALEIEAISVRAKVSRHDFAFAQRIAGLSDAPLDPAPDVCLDDPALLIYTSGTTGLPKAAIVSHRRVMLWTHWFAGMMDTGPADRLYNCLPMYHSVGGVAAPGALLVGGGAVICREKFSARGFWPDIAASGATIFQYIGELCRYLLAPDAAAQFDEKTGHNLRLICGNGLSGDVWVPFQERFSIPQIVEFYAATEGNFSLYNMEGKPGAIGRVPASLAPLIPVALIQHDEAAGAPMRGADGLCIPAARGAVGEAICKITDGAARFEGYTDTAANSKKILRHVFARGDAWFRSGDLMRKDSQGFYYFVDRLGDTFRWKSENVATTQVAAILGSAPQVIAAVVYGVAVPGTEGRAGMAALEVAEGFDLAVFRKHIAERLPGYARPVFLRRTASLAITGTFKHRKNDLARDGFDPSRTTDPLFADIGGAYVALDAALYSRISCGLIRL